VAARYPFWHRQRSWLQPLEGDPVSFTEEEIVLIASLPEEEQVTVAGSMLVSKIILARFHQELDEEKR
jgi:hypothetical protein